MQRDGRNVLSSAVVLLVVLCFLEKKVNGTSIFQHVNLPEPGLYAQHLLSFSSQLDNGE